MNIFLYKLLFTLNLVVLTYCLQAQSLNNTLSNIKIKKNTANNAEQPFSVQDVVQLVRFFMSQNGIERCESDLYTRKLKLVAHTGIDLNEMLNNKDLNNKIKAMGYTMEIPLAAATNASPAIANTTAPKTTPETSNNTATNSNAKASADKKALLEKAKALSANKTNGVAAPIKATTPSPATAKPDCADCGEVKVDEKLKESIVKDANYGGTQLLIDLPMGNYDDSSKKSNSNKPNTTPTMNAAQLDSLRQVLFKKSPK